MAKETTKSSSLIERIRKTSTIKEASVLSESRFFNRTVSDSAPTPVKALNIALGGDINGGLTPGHTGIAGPSRHFKSNVALLLAASYMKKHKDSIMIFYDSEFGSPSSYFKAFSIDMDRVFHIPVTNLEQLKFDIMKQLEEITDKDNVIIVIDSIGNLASKKEVDDALKESDKTDMTRARVIKGLFRMVTPLLTLKDIPLITILHVYQEMCLAGETKIMTDLGAKAIKDIREGDMVYALSGLKKVTHKFNPHDLPGHGKTFLKITFDDGSSVRATDNHRFLDENKNWLPAKEFKIGTKLY